MRIFPDQEPAPLRRARLRRRVFLTLFGCFLVGSLLALIYFGTMAGRTNPPVELHRIAEDAQAEALWQFSLAPPHGNLELLAVMAPERLVPGARMEPYKRPLHATGALLLYSAETDDPSNPRGALLCLPVRRPQRLYLEPWMLLAETPGRVSDATRGHLPQARVSRHFVLLASNEDLLRWEPGKIGLGEGGPTTFRSLEPNAALQFEGPLDFLPESVGRDLHDFDEAGGIAGEDRVLVVWTLRGREVRLEALDGAAEGLVLELPSPLRVVETPADDLPGEEP